MHADGVRRAAALATSAFGSYSGCRQYRENILQALQAAGVDDMVIVRGVNVFPSAIENVMREFPALAEFRIEVFEKDAMREIKLVLEPRSDLGSTGELAEQVSRRMRERIGLRPIVEFVAPGTLPRFELKARRFFKL